MLIKNCKGYELEKEKSNTSEDFFNRSEITFVEDGQEKVLHVLYVRYFDEVMNEFTPFEGDPIFQAGQREVLLRDIVALVCLITNPGYRHRKRVYINSQKEFSSLFQHIDFPRLAEIFQSLEEKNHYDLRSPMEFIVQPQ